jgi:hypothetical protein
LRGSNSFSIRAHSLTIPTRLPQAQASDRCSPMRLERWHWR